MRRNTVPNKSVLKQQFINLTNSKAEEAVKWLEESRWNLEESVNSYLNWRASKETEKRVYDHALISIFDKYSSKGNPHLIEVDGTIAYLEDLKVEPEDPMSLSLAFMLNAPSMGVFEEESFLDKWSESECNSLEEMKCHLEKFHAKIYSDETLFTQLYNFCFGFLMELPGQRLLAYDTAIDYWELLLIQNSRFSSCKQRLNQWTEFVASEYKRGFSKDSWQMFYIFVKTIMLEDPEHLSGYDELSAWPSVIDEYIEYLKENGLLS